MKVLSVKPRWAELIMSGAKRIENRSWRPGHRGTIGLHASAPVCAILGTVDVLEILGWEEALVAYPEQEQYIIRGMPTCRGLWCWILANPKPLLFQYPCKGRLHLWDAPKDFEKALVTRHLQYCPGDEHGELQPDWAKEEEEAYASRK